MNMVELCKTIHFVSLLKYFTEIQIIGETNFSKDFITLFIKIKNKNS